MSFAANAYTRTANSVLSPREAEAAVLIKAAQQLQMVKDDWTNQSANLNKALNFNQKVWTLLAGAATAPESPLPIAIKNNIGQLSVFVFRRIIDTLIDPGADKLSALININQQIAAGLRSS